MINNSFRCITYVGLWLSTYNWHAIKEQSRATEKKALSSIIFFFLWHPALIRTLLGIYVSHPKHYLINIRKLSYLADQAQNDDSAEYFQQTKEDDSYLLRTRVNKTRNK